ncbi:hypothetical protein WJX74_010953 [Apatococcus lobatus]|uniref:Uncharacterized protein n=1 Tax=Apatococcus lobatus TaxID=904363 RepID=A0AAW1RQY7_9CHLO
MMLGDAPLAGHRKYSLCSSAQYEWGCPRCLRLLPLRPCGRYFKAPRHRKVTAQASKDSGPGKAPDPGTDLAVFQFTLGIPGFDDALVPRIVGAAVIVLLIANHLAASNPAPAQWRTEAVGGVLGLIGIAAPSVDRLLKSQLPGRGRAKSATLEATTSVLAFSGNLPQNVKQELAWCTYSLVCNVNCSCVLIVDGDNAVIGARGFFGQSPMIAKQSEDNLQLFTRIWRQMQAGAQAESKSEPSQQMSEAAQRLPAELRAILTAGTARDIRACRAPSDSQGVSILMVAEPSARLSPSELKWASMIAQKVQSCLQPQPAH